MKIRNRSTLKSLLKRLIIVQESVNKNIVNVRGVRGYGVGHTYPVKDSPKPDLGDPGPYREEKVQPQVHPVKISKAFKNKKRK
jgi:hypothetical protein